MIFYTAVFEAEKWRNPTIHLKDFLRFIGFAITVLRVNYLEDAGSV